MIALNPCGPGGFLFGARVYYSSPSVGFVVLSVSWEVWDYSLAIAFLGYVGLP